MNTLAAQIERSFRGGAWHGPAVLEALHGVDAELATRKPPAGLHTIADQVQHLATWLRITLATVKGAPYQPPADESEDWPVLDGDWETAIAEMTRINDELVAATRTVTPEKLAEPVANRDYNVEFLLQGIVQHNVYHAGQIVVLRRILS